ncbi:hypothetical protein VPH35_033922 [Triticum aestivum]
MVRMAYVVTREAKQPGGVRSPARWCLRAGFPGSVLGARAITPPPLQSLPPAAVKLRCSQVVRRQPLSSPVYLSEPIRCLERERGGSGMGLMMPRSTVQLPLSYLGLG